MKKFLIFVAGDKNNNKYYNMIQNGSEFIVKYGRVGGHETTKTYPMSRWDRTISSKLRKGYKDISDLKAVKTVVQSKSGNTDFDNFYQVFSKYTKGSVSSSYLVDTTTPQQIQEAQKLLDEITALKKVKKINSRLEELYKVIPRRMGKVSDYLISDVAQKNTLLAREQNALDGMDSANVINTVNPYEDLNIEFKELDQPPTWLRDKIEATNTGYRRRDIYKCFKLATPRLERFENWIKDQKNPVTEHLFHGTRCPNIFSILKSGLMIRPTNAAYISGAAYGDGIYMSKDTGKSLGYVGNDPDALFLISNCHIGKQYEYKGWYRDGKDISRSEMSYQGMKKRNCDSLYVHSGDGLLSSELIFYKEDQVVIDYIIWFK